VLNLTRDVKPYSLTHSVDKWHSATPDLYGYPPQFTPVPKYTAWWRRHMYVNDLSGCCPKAHRPELDPASCWSCDLTTTPHTYTHAFKALVTTTIRLRFDRNSTALYDHSTTYVTTELLHRSLKQAVAGRPPRYAPPLYAARCGPAPAHIHALRLAFGARLASSSCGLLEYSRCTRQTSSDVRQHHCLMPPPRGRGIIDKQVSVTAASVLRHSDLNDLW